MTITEPKTQPKYVKRRYLSVSTLVRYARCPRLYFYEKCGLRSDNLNTRPEYGSAMHCAVPVALETGDLQLSMKAFVESWRPIEEQLDVLGEEEPERNRRTAERSLKHFIHTHQGRRSIYKLKDPPEGKLPRPIDKSKFEVPWAIDIGLPIPLVGQWDGLCEHRDTGEDWIWELKTTSRLNASFFDAHEMYLQNLIYTAVGLTALNCPVRGVMLEGMLVHKTKADNQIHPLPVQEHHIEEALQWAYKVGMELLNAEKVYLETLEQGRDDAHCAFLKDFTGCTPYSHFYMPGFRCDFADLCRVPDYRVMTSLYRVTEDHDFLQGVDLTVDPNAKRS